MEKAFLDAHGKRLTLEEVLGEVASFVVERSGYAYSLIIGTDSLATKTSSSFVSAIIVRRKGNGGRYFYRRTEQKGHIDFRQRLFWEVSMSLELAQEINSMTEKLDLPPLTDLPLEIHLDIGHIGPSKEILREAIGMVRGSGFFPLTKPESYGASTVADKFTR